MIHNWDPGHGQNCCRILIADDDSLLRDTIEVLLASYFSPLEVFHAGDGLEAMTLAVSHLPDLILLDGHMPLVNGDKAAAFLRQAISTPAIPLVAVSAEIGRSAMGDRLQDLCDLCLAKPFSAEELIAAVEQGLNGREQPLGHVESGQT